MWTSFRFQTPSVVQDGRDALELDALCSALDGTSCDTLVDVQPSAASQGPDNCASTAQGNTCKFPFPKCVRDLADWYRSSPSGREMSSPSNYVGPSSARTSTGQALYNVSSYWSQDQWVQTLQSSSVAGHGTNRDRQAWWWQRCTQLGYFPSTAASDVMGGKHGWGITADVFSCDSGDGSSQGECAVEHPSQCRPVLPALPRTSWLVMRQTSGPANCLIHTRRERPHPCLA